MFTTDPDSFARKKAALVVLKLAVIADFDHSEGDQLLIRKEHIDSVVVQFAGNLGAHGEAHFWLQSERGLTGIQTTAGTTVDDILGAIAAM